jgi:hypothetical protein
MLPWVSRSEAACTSAAASPISVFSPVLFTQAKHSPARTTNPESSTRWSALSGTFRGVDSPVSAEVSTCISSPSTHTQSAGTTMPPFSKTTSPGTIWEDPMMAKVPSRLTEAWVLRLARSAFTSPCDFHSSMNLG